jgi:hypothetical protein
LRHIQQKREKRIKEKKIASMQTVAPFGQNQMQPQTTQIQCRRPVIPMIELVWSFIKEHHDTPHECSKCHSSLDFKCVCCFNWHLQ